MTVISVDTDHDTLTVTVISEFDVPVERVWELWADPRKLERWWGPPSFPATFETHDLVAGGEVRYVMTSPGGDKYAGRWRVHAADPPTWLQFDDVFVDTDGQPAVDLPDTAVSIRLLEHDGGTRMVMESRFKSSNDLENWLNTGTREGLQQAIAQMDELLRPEGDDRQR